MTFLRRIWQAVLSFFSSIFSAEVNVLDHVNSIVRNFQDGKAAITDGINMIRNFHFDPRWKTRVINVPIAIEQVQEIYAALFSDFSERLRVLVEPVHQLSLIFHAERENPDPLGGPSALARTAVKVDEIATMIAQLDDASKVALDFANLFDEIVGDLETLDVIFLSQRNKRRWVTEAHSRIRLGALH